MVTTHTIAYATSDRTVSAHLAKPDGEGPWPAILIAHDGVGLEEYQRERAGELAARGFIALAMDYHDGEVFFDRPEAMLARVMPMLADLGQMQDVGRAALKALLEQPGADPKRIAALGYGAGGKIVLELARTGVPFNAIAAVHPALPASDAESLAGVTGSVLLCTGSDDPICTPRDLLAFGGALQAVGVDWRANIYGGAEHAFWARPRNADGSAAEGDSHTMATVPGVGHHGLHAARAWRAVLDMFEETFSV